MAKLSLNLDTRTAKDGKYQIRIRIAHYGTSAYIGTQAYVLENEYTGDIKEPVCKGSEDFFYVTNRVFKIVSKLQNTIEYLDSVDKLYSMNAAQIKETLYPRRPIVEKKQEEKQAEKPKVQIIKRDESFSAWFEKFSQKYANEKTRTSVLYFDGLMMEFNAQRKNVPCGIVYFHELTYAFLSDFETYLIQSGRGEYVRYCAFSYIRAACLEATRRKMMSRDENPFDDFKIKKPIMSEEIEYVSESAMRKFLSMDLRPLQGEMGLSRARDIAMISFYLCGMNFKDIYELPKQSNGEVVFVRSKIANRRPRPVHIAITPELQKLIDKYSGKTHLFNFAETNGSFATVQCNLTERLRRLSAFVGETVSMSLIRHTWATYAGKLDIDDSVIDKSMGHKDSSILNIHYKQYDWSKTDIANRKVIDYIMDGVVENSVYVPKYIRDAGACV